jgi:DNA-binding response OmpR family regulator
LQGEELKSEHKKTLAHGAADNAAKDDTNSHICRVLCVDDHADTLKLYDFALRREGFETSLAATADEARSYFQNQAFDVFILDSVLGPNSGVSLCAEVRECQPDAAILIISGQVARQDREKALAAGADEFLPKPVALDDLWSVARRLVDGKCSLQNS